MDLVEPATSATNPRDIVSQKPDSSLALLWSRALVVIAFLAQIIVAWRFWSITWDDSAITLGFSRTFAFTGKIEPTPGSGIVEGYSTTLWMLLMAAAAKVITTPSALLAFAKISTLLLNLCNIVLIRRWLATWTPELLANLVAGSIGCTLMFYETINGMETPIILTFVLVMLLLLPLDSRVARFGYLLAGSALVLTRWEAAWLLVPFVLIEKPFRRALTSASVWLSVFVISNLVRWHYFGYLLPNTITAKQGFPYSQPTLYLKLMSHITEPLAILYTIKALIVVTALCLLYNRSVNNQPLPRLERLRQYLQTSWQLRFTLLFCLFSFILSSAIGHNGGPALRSFYSAWPFLFCLPLLAVTLNLRSRAIPWATATLCLYALLIMSLRIRDMRSEDAPIYLPHVTVDNTAVISTTLSHIQSATHRTDLLFAGPDMGGLILYSKGIRVVDLGLLCDSVLAHQRYAVIDTYVLQQRQPDVIEVHGDWAEYTNFQAYPLFRSRYRPVYVDGIRVFLTNDLIANVDPSRLTEVAYDAAGLPAKADAFDENHNGVHNRAGDIQLNRTFGRYFVLRQ
jgi:hypothetical protein